MPLGTATKLAPRKSTGDQPRSHPLPATLFRSKSKPENVLHPLISAQFTDDQGGHHYDAPSDPDSMSEELTGTDTNEKRESEEEDEVLDGIKDERDVERRPKRLERLRSSRSFRDEYLVCNLPITRISINA